MTESLMTKEDVAKLYSTLSKEGIKIWIEGGWSVDALLGKQTRPHRDLDITLEWKDVPKLREILAKSGYQQVKEDSKWNFVLNDSKGHEIDVHAVVFDDKGNIVDGIMYPANALTGNGTINNQPVRCISPEFMVEALAKWIHKWPDKYVPAVLALCKKFNIELPEEYKSFIIN